MMQELHVNLALCSLFGSWVQLCVGDTPLRGRGVLFGELGRRSSQARRKFRRPNPYSTSSIEIITVLKLREKVNK